MLVISLVLSALLLLIGYLVVRRSEAPVGGILLLALVLAIGPVGLGLVLPPVLIQAVAMVLVATVCHIRAWPPRRFAWLSCLATLVVYASISWLALQTHSRLHEQFPCVSMEDRLALPATAGKPLAESAEEMLASIDEGIEHYDGPYSRGQQRRLRHLEQLHGDTVRAFANRPGFGVGRMNEQASEWSLRFGLREEKPIPQPGTRISFAWSSGELDAPPEPGNRNWGFGMHVEGVIDFVNPIGFGYFKDRRHVAGFQSHQFSKPPEPEGDWTLHTLDLLGLVVHTEPVVYITANLPRMDELRQASTRPPDDFERAGLHALRDGEDLFVRDRVEGRRMLGAIRSARQCVACHGGERGDLLGAFSYTLTGGPER